MFGLFKKKDDSGKVIQNLLLNLTLLQSWSLDVMKRNLSSEDIMLVLNRMTQKPGLNATKEQLFAVQLMAISNTDLEAGRELRKKSNFDANAVMFCRNLGLDERFYTR